MTNKLKSRLPVALNTQFWCKILINDEKAKKQPLACFKHTF